MTVKANSQRRGIHLPQPRDFVILIIAIVLFTGALWAMNRWLFPQGSGLGEAALDRTTSLAPGTAARPLSVSADQSGEPLAVATLTRVTREARFRSAGDIAWSEVDAGAALHNQDAIQTLEKSAATIKFGDKDQLQLGARSLLVIQSMSDNVFMPSARRTLSLSSGRLSGALVATADGGNGHAFDIELPHGRLRLEGGEQTRFSTSINPDNTSTVSIFDGSARLFAAGTSVLLGTNQGATFSADDTQIVTHSLPGTPAIVGPGSADSVYYGDLPPLVRFAWRATDKAKQFRFVLARDPQFEHLIVDQRTSSSHFDHNTLDQDEYFWRVSSVDGWQESAPSRSRKLTIIRDQLPPKLDLIPASGGAPNNASLSGYTDPDATVFVAGERVSIDDNGYFKHRITRVSGAAVVVVEAVDPVGNITFAQHIFHTPVISTGGDTP